MTQIAIIEDDRILQGELARILDLHGYSPICWDQTTDVYEFLLAYKPDALLLDLSLPRIHGHEVVRALRTEERLSVLRHIPVIVVTSSQSEYDELLSMNLGADDVVTKPYNPAILIARLDSVMRRASVSAVTSQLTCGDLAFSPLENRASSPTGSVDLSRNEAKILHTLMIHEDAIVSRSDLMVELWQSDAFVDDNTLTVNVNRLRKSLRHIGCERYLITKRGIGYVLTARGE